MDELQVPSSVEGSSRAPQRLDKGKGAQVAANLEVLHAPLGLLVMLGSKINDPQFLASDVVHHDLNQALCVLSRLNLPIQTPGTSSWGLTFCSASV